MVDAVVSLLTNAPIPAILIVAGALFLFFAIGGTLSESLRVEKINPRLAMFVGIAFVAAGIAVELWTHKLDGGGPVQVASDVQAFTETVVEPAPPPTLRDSAKARLEAVIREGLRRKAEMFIQAMLPPEQIKALEDNSALLDLIGESFLKFGKFEILDRKLANGDPGIEAYGEAILHIKDIEREILNLGAQQPLMRELQALREQTRTLSRQLELVEARYKSLPEASGAPENQTQLAEKKTELEKAANKLATQLNSSEMYRQALVKKALGRTAEEKQLLNELISAEPDHVQARLMRNLPEDWSYLIQFAPTASKAPYLAAARDAWNRNEIDEARDLLRKALGSFNDLTIVEINFNYDDAQISFATILASLTLEASDGSWNKPPNLLRRDLLVGKNYLLLWYPENKPVDLRFSRYGFLSTTVDVPEEDLNQKSIKSYTMRISATAPNEVTNTVTGKIVLADHVPQSGQIGVLIFDNWNENRGFRRTARTSENGSFSVTGIPNGKFELEFRKDGYVPYNLGIDVRQQSLRCFVDDRRHFEKRGIFPCNLGELDLQLYPVRRVKIEWTLQEEPATRHFRGQVSTGQVELRSELPDDWFRGGWGCCQSSFNFGRARVDGSSADIVVVTETDGTIYFDQPHAPFIALSFTDYNELYEVPESQAFMTRAEVKEGQTYILKTNRDTNAQDTQFYVKIRVLSIVSGPS